MKKCSYCGKEYADDLERCAIDGAPLSGGVQTASDNEEKAALISEPAAARPHVPWTDTDFRIFEVFLVCIIAFGTSILFSGHSLIFGGSASPSSGGFVWIYNCVREASALGLLWYVLQRRQMSFAGLGLKWAPMDIGRSIVLQLVGSLAYYAAYEAAYFAGFTATSHTTATAHVGHILFGGGIYLATILFQFLNPFFEELIVRAYLMTEVKQITNSATKAVILSTLIQTSYHFYQGVPVAVAHGATFLIFSLYYAKTNRIAPIILAHLYSDVGGTLFYMIRQ